MQSDSSGIPCNRASKKAYKWPEAVSLEGCPSPIALRFGTRAVHGYVPLYLANGTGSDLLDVTVASRGLTCAYGGLETSRATKELGLVRTGTGRLIEAYDVYFDGDFVVFYTIEARLPGGDRFRGRAFTKGVPWSRWLRVEDSAPVLDRPSVRRSSDRDLPS